MTEEGRVRDGCRQYGRFGQGRNLIAEIGTGDDSSRNQPSSNPCAFPMPMRAIPMVAIVVHELPVITEINTQIIQADVRKKLGWIICIP